MGHTRSIIIDLVLVLGQTAGAAAADLGLPPPPPVEVAPCVGCAGPWYIRGFVGGANPHVDIMLGVRWKLGSQPAPMPVAFK